MSPQKRNHWTSERGRIEALLKEKLDQVEPSRGFRDLLLERLMRKQRRLFPSFSALNIWTGAALSSFVAFVVITSGYAYISPAVTRQSNLYFLKQFFEGVELKIASFNDEEVAKTYLKLAERRLEEAKVLSDRGVIDSPTIEQMSRDMNDALTTTEKLPQKDKEKVRTILKENAPKKREQISMLADKLRRKEGDTLITPQNTSVAIEKNEKSVSNLEKESFGALPYSKGLNDAMPPSFGTPNAKPQAPLPSVSVSKETRETVISGAIANFEKKAEDFQAMENATSATNGLNQMKIMESDSLPDLKISLSDLSSKGKEQTMNVIVENIGLKASEKFIVEVKWGDGLFSRLTFLPLPPKEKKTLPASHRFETSGSFTIIATVNPDKAGPDRSYSNNVTSTTVTIEEPKTSCIDSCKYEGATRCNGNTVDICGRSAEGCLAWRSENACSSTKKCIDGTCKATPSICGNGIKEENEQCGDGNIE